MEFLRKIQTAEGCWVSEYGGPMFLIPGLVISTYLCDISLSDAHITELIRYLRTNVTREGGWGLYAGGPCTVFGTSLNYIALRLLGMDPTDSMMKKARQCLQRLGGAVGIPTWGKFWLACLGCYSWSGITPLLPELWYVYSFFSLIRIGCCLIGCQFSQEIGGAIIA